MPLDGIKNIVLVLSGKGGVGKSSVTLQLALALTLQGRSVGILDVDLTGPSIPRLVGKEDAKITQAPGGWVPVLVHPAAPGPASTSDNSSVASPHPPSSAVGAGAGATTDTDTVTDISTGPSQPSTATIINTDTNTNRSTSAQQPPSSQSPPTQSTPRGSLRCISLGFLLHDRGDAVIWRGPKKTAMIRQFLTDVLWGETDYLLIDTPPGTSDEHIALAEQLLTIASTTSTNSSQQQQQQRSQPLLTGAILVTTPQAISTADVRKELNFCAKTCIPVIGVVENMSGYSCPCCGEVTNVFSSGGGRAMAEEMGVRFLGAVPIDVGFGEMVEGVGGRGEGEADGVVRNGIGGGNAGEREGGELLVERYRKCWSRPLFEEFAKTIIQEAERSGE
ncbi:cytosolic Fe-S cluster assembly factor cfd1 [Paracoccidioides brasiliensis]|nr:cytosolic Fe-S cluster assembly factor cfd1 [Paracoccidioides brasiliensis]